MKKTDAREWHYIEPLIKEKDFDLTMTVKESVPDEFLDYCQSHLGHMRVMSIKINHKTGRLEIKLKPSKEMIDTFEYENL